jgi:polyphosphate kinase
MPSVFDAIRGGDILLHHPYQSFNPVIELLEQSAADPQVVAIKMTVYRTGTDSVLMQSLLRAAQNGKEVTVVVELMARFDEEANIGWATKLEEVGAHVIYGVVGYKTHAKMLMIVRREESKAGGSVLRRYVHLGTGNYHPKTARLYSDFGLLTCNEDIGADANEVFKQLTGLGRAQTLKHLWQAPFSLQPNVVAGIRAEAEAARAGKRSRIIAKMNSLLEPETIAALYEASQAGVKIDLIVRGVCGLRAGVKDLSENINVRSIIGRQLEHHRVFYFYADGEEKVYLSSADWMDRNFFRRIELAFPILDRKLKRRVITEGLQIYLTDNTLAWELGAGWQLPPAARLTHQPAFVASRTDRTAEGLTKQLRRGVSAGLARPRQAGATQARLAATTPSTPCSRLSVRLSCGMLPTSAVKRIKRLTLPGLRIDRDDVEFFAREHVRDVAQQSPGDRERR